MLTLDEQMLNYADDTLNFLPSTSFHLVHQIYFYFSVVWDAHDGFNNYILF